MKTHSYIKIFVRVVSEKYEFASVADNQIYLT